MSEEVVQEPDIGVDSSQSTHPLQARIDSDVICARGAFPWRIAARAVLQCITSSASLLLRGQTRLPRDHVGQRLQFADGSSSKVFRETSVDGVIADNPCLLVVKFRLRLLHGGWHRLFLWECILNTPLFVGFRGFISKFWLDRDEYDNYRGLYEWSDPEDAEFYARSLWWVLSLVCQRDSIDYVIVPGVRRDEMFSDPKALASLDSASDAWWRVVEDESAPSRHHAHPL